ncbi:MAG: hypothetical protein IJX14_05215 [Clostridia bacterium]|nr:hypothetical protein [Clostridia bacterium]
MDNREKLVALEEQIHRKGRLETKLRYMQKEAWDLRYAIEMYARQAAEEQGDVDTLTGRTLKGFLARLQKNSYQDRLTREQAEAAAALAKWESARTRLAELETDMAQMSGEIRELRMVEREYETCLTKRREQLAGDTGPGAEVLAALEKEAEEIRAKKREVDEAVTAGKRVRALAGQIDREFSEAQEWGTWDAWGGGMLSGAAKYEHLDKAGRMIESLQKLIGDFRAELADVSLFTDVQVEIDEFTRFADIFWDGIFVDLTVLEKIREARERIRILQRELDDVMQTLQAMTTETDGKLAVNEAALRRLLTEAER